MLAALLLHAGHAQSVRDWHAVMDSLQVWHQQRGRAGRSTSYGRASDGVRC